MLEQIYNEILENTTQYNRSFQNRWFAEKFKNLQQYLPFQVSTLSEVGVILKNNLVEWPTCKVCGAKVKKIEKTYCSPKCSANDPSNKKQRNDTLKKTYLDNPQIIVERSKKWKESVSSKSESELEEWKLKLSEAAKKKENNADTVWKEERSQKLSNKLKTYYETVPLTELYKRVKKTRTTKLEKGIIGYDRTEFLMYSRTVRNMTLQTYRRFKTDINPDNLEQGSFTGEDLYHIDHIVSIKDGFENNIPPFIMASKYNLQMLLVEDNCSKNKRSAMEIDALLNTFYLHRR